MKIETSLLAGLLLIGTSLLTRIAVQGIEQALFTMIIEYGLSSVAAGRKFIANVVTGAVRHKLDEANFETALADMFFETQ